MSRAKYLTLITWLGSSASARRFFFVFPFVFAATAAHAPVVKSATITNSPSVTAAKNPGEPIHWQPDPQNIPDRISLMHPSAADPPADSPLVLRDTADFKPISSSHDLQSPIPLPTASIAVTNDPPTAQPVTQLFPTDRNDSALLSQEFDAPVVGRPGDGGLGAGFGVNDPISTGGGGGGDPGTPSVTTAVPEPACIWLLPAATILLRRRKIACVLRLVSPI